MKIAYFSPLNPLKTGISDYSEELLPHLSKEIGTIDLFVDEFQPTSKEILSEFNIFKIKEFDNLYSEYDEIIYHIGNNCKYHENIYKTALKYPGIVVLHDFALHHLIAQLTVGRNNWDSYIEEMRYNSGVAGVNLALGSRNGTRKVIWETSDTLQYPVNKRLIDQSKAVIVHSQFAKREIITNIKEDAFVQYAPLFANDIEKVNKEEMLKLRKEYGINTEHIVFGSFGFISRAKRVDTVIDAINDLKNKYTNFTYLLVGEEEKNVYEMSKYIRELKLEKYVKFIGYVTLNQFKDYVKMCDICINLRYPTQGETSASLLRILGYGKPAIVTDIGSFSEIPNSVCMKVKMENEKEDITRAIEWFLCNQSLLEEMGTNAYQFVKENCKIKDTVESYKKAINAFNIDTFSTDARYFNKNLNNITMAMHELGIESNESYIENIAASFAELYIKN